MRVADEAEWLVAGWPVDVAGRADITFAEVLAVMRLQAAWLNQLCDQVERACTLAGILDDRLIDQAAAAGRPVWRPETATERAGEHALGMLRSFRSEGA